jgi:hypothetical protein
VAGRDLAVHLYHRARREKAAAQRARQAYDELTVEARAAMAMASSLTHDELAAVLDALVRKGKDGDAAAARELRQWVELSTRLIGQADTTDGVSWGDVTPQQRATARAEIERRLAEIAIAATETREDGDARPAAT